MSSRLVGSALVLLAVLLGAILYSRSPAAPILVPDSAAYARFDPMATATYPLFLRLVGTAHATAFQFALFAACAGLFATVIYRELESALIGAAALFAMAVNPEVNRFHATIMSESLFLSVDLLFLTATTMYVTRRRLRWAIAAGALAGLAATIRPISLPLIAGFVLVIPLILNGRGWRDIMSAASLCCLAWIIVTGAERLYSHSVHGPARTSLAGPHLYAKSVLIDAPVIDKASLDPLEHRYAVAAERDYEPVRQLLGKADGGVAEDPLRAFYQVCIQHGCSAPIRHQAGASRAEGNSAMLKVAVMRLSQAPLEYLSLAADEYKLLWALNSRTHPARAEQYDAFIRTVRPLPLEEGLDENVVLPTEASRIAYIVRPAFIAVGIALAFMVLAFPALALRAPRNAFILLGLVSALSVELVFIFTAFTGIPEGRYTMGMWPQIALAMLCLGGLLLRLARPGTLRRDGSKTDLDQGEVLR